MAAIQCFDGMDRQDQLSKRQKMPIELLSLFCFVFLPRLFSKGKPYEARTSGDLAGSSSLSAL
jgi:hypothetical protein